MERQDTQRGNWHHPTTSEASPPLTYPDFPRAPSRPVKASFPQHLRFLLPTRTSIMPPSLLSNKRCPPYTTLSFFLSFRQTVIDNGSVKAIVCVLLYPVSFIITRQKSRQLNYAVGAPTSIPLWRNVSLTFERRGASIGESLGGWGPFLWAIARDGEGEKWEIIWE